jgi:hypothetical protein
MVCPKTRSNPEKKKIVEEAGIKKNEIEGETEEGWY